MQLEFDLINDGRGIGADTDERLHVIAIGQGGPADGKLQLGDVILAINDISITSKSHLENTILSVGSSIKVRVSRAGGDSSNAHNVEPVENDCTAMTEVILKYTVGSKQKLGLGVSSVNDKIRVSKVLRGSVADDLLHEGDIIDEIDGVRPTSKEHTRNLLVGALKKNGQVVLKVTCLLRGEKKGDEPSVMMKSDVLEIAQRQKERLLNLRGENKPAIRGILGRYTRPPDQRDDKRLNVETEHHSLMIELESARWYHGMLPREDIQQLLTEDGHFLVRQSEVKIGEGLKTILSVRWNGKFHHFVISHEDGRFFIEKYQFDSISDLIRFYTMKKKPITRRTGALIVYGVPKQHWELHHDQVKLGRLIAEGGFGGIYEALVKINDRTVKAAVKVHKGRALDKEIIKNICNEARIMRRYSHPNIVRLYGVAVGRDPIMVVMEHVKDGALDSYLAKRGRWLCISEKVRMCLDAASGLEYLHKMGCIHRDVSARWLAPETLMTATYTTKSDVFSYGILLWEIFMDAAEPYFGMTIAEVNEQVKSGYRMPAPDCMPKPIQKVMCVYCFVDNPEERLSMKEIHEYLQNEYGSLQTEVTVKDT